MCEDCWVDYEPAPVTPAIKNAVAWLCALYNHNAAGGNLHVYVDDWNLPVPASMEEWGRCLSPFTPTAAELGCWKAMSVLSQDEQATALAIFDGYYRPTPSVLPMMNAWDGEPFWSDEVEDAFYAEPVDS